MKRLPILLSRTMVIGALIAALILAIAHGASKGTEWYLKLAFIIGLACVAIGEFQSWHNAATAWHERRLGSLSLWALLGVILSAGTLYTNFSSSAGVNDTKAGVIKSAMVVQTDTASTEAELTKKNNDLLQRIEMAPKRGPEAAQAAINRAKADRFWNVTSGCTETKGPQTRAFCDAYASAVADLEGGKNLKVWRAEQEQIAAELKEVRSARAAAGPAIVSDDQAAVVTLAAVANMSVKAARQADSMVLPVLVQAMLLFGGILLANEHFRGRPRLPWVDLAKWRRRFDALRKGELPPVEEHLQDQITEAVHSIRNTPKPDHIKIEATTINQLKGIVQRPRLIPAAG